MGISSLGSWALGFLGGSRETSTLWQVSGQVWFFTSGLLTLVLRFSKKKLSLYLGLIAVVTKNKLLCLYKVYLWTVISRIQPSFENLFYTFCQAF